MGEIHPHLVRYWLHSSEKVDSPETFAEKVNEYGIKDEYINEATKIYEYVYSKKNLQIQTLAEKINTIFIKAFGIDVYDENIEQCILIAKKILE